MNKEFKIPHEKKQKFKKQGNSNCGMWWHKAFCEEFCNPFSISLE